MSEEQGQTEQLQVKMVIVIRTHFPDGKGGILRPRLGKMIVQGSHAASEFLIERMDRVLAPRLCGHPGWTRVEAAWLATGRTKICVQVESREELLELHRRAYDAGLPAALITDEGRTEFKEATETALAIGPALSSEIDKITANLKLL